MLKTLLAASAALAAASVLTVSGTTGAEAASQITQGSLRGYCNAIKPRLGLARASLNRIQIGVDNWGSPLLRCHFVTNFGSRRAVHRADPGAVCRYATGNARWYRNGRRVYCNGRTASNGTSIRPLFVRPVRPLRRPRCFFVNFRWVCR